MTNAIVGSSPSITPAAHTTIGTGTFPNEHGIVSIHQREGEAIVQAYEGSEPVHLEVPTLADLYDLRENNRAQIGMFSEKNWQLGMIGHGSATPGGDKDIDIMITEGGDGFFTNPDYYRLPGYLDQTKGLSESIRRVDLADGRLDGRWLGRATLSDLGETLKTPAWVLFQTKLLKTVLRRDNFGENTIPDMFFMNYKEMDHLGHLYNMLGPEVGDTLGYADDSLGQITHWLNAKVGRRRWVLTVTADHGMTPDPNTSGAWPIDAEVVEAAIAGHLDVEAEELFEQQKPNGYWINSDVLEASGSSLEDIATYLLGYTLEDNAGSVDEVPKAYRDRLSERLFVAAFPSEATDDLLTCARKLR